MLKHETILLFDFETTGLDPNREQIIEIGAIRMEKLDGKYVETGALDVLIDVGAALPAKITEITGITDAMLKEKGVSPEEAAAMIHALYDEKALLVAYNLQFDVSFLRALFRRYLDPSFDIKNDILDVMCVYKDLHPYPHRLSSALEHYAIPAERSHRAIDDIRNTYRLLLRLSEVLKDDIGFYVNVIGFNPKYRVSGIMLPHVSYVPQRGGLKEVWKNKKKIHP
ncbi:MAG: PolC-type DNA polymerase III [Acholeplasmataceae bacterium]